MRKNISPYSGDTFHETPLSLVVADQLVKCPQIVVFLIFILIDVLTAFILAFAVEEARRFYVWFCLVIALLFNIMLNFVLG